MIYTDGTIAIKAGSPIVTGTGTQWKKNIHGVAPGQLISIENGTAPVSMMIRAVNSDTELVLSFNAPVTLSGAKYAIATTVPDTISDAARTMSANQGYIVYFLQAMQQWMTDTGQVEIELPNGQKVTLEDLKGLASREWVNTVLFGVGDKTAKASGIMNPDNTMWWGVHNDYLYAKQTNKNYNNFEILKNENINVMGVLNVKSLGNYTSLNMLRMDGSGVLFQTSPYSEQPDSSTCITLVERNSTNKNIHSWAFPREGNGRTVATRQWIKEHGIAITSETPPWLGDFNSHSIPSGMSRYTNANTPGRPPTAVGYGSVITARYDSTILQSIVLPNYGGTYLHVNRYDGTRWENVVALTSNMYIVDGSGYYKKSSPIVQIYPDGHYDTNDESEGAEVSRIGTGQYHITGILGYNSDGAWGVNGGISVPKDNNGLELVYVDDRVQEDGSIIIETCHRQHAHLPERFQNWRLKEVTPEGERVFWQDGEPCDLPESTRLDVRVEMPQGSVWNVKQRELAEQMEREQAEREAQEAAEQGVDSDQ